MKTIVLDSIGSVAYYNYSLCKTLMENNCDVELLTCPFIADSEFNYNDIKCKYVFFRWTNKIKPKDNTAWYYKLFRTIKGIEYIIDTILVVKYILNKRPDVIHIQWLEVPRLDIFWIKYLKRRGFNIVLTIHNLLPHEEKKRHHVIYREIYESLDKLIVHSCSDRSILNTLFGIDVRKIAVIPIGNCNLYITRSDIDQMRARIHLKINTDLQVVLFFGLLRPYKGLDCLIDAWKTVQDAVRTAHLLVVGKKLMSLKSIEKKINRSAMQSSITFCDNYVPFDHVQYYFRAADIAVFPYVKTYNSAVLQLAYSFSLPVVATNTGGMPEAVDTGASGILVEPQTPDALAAAIVELLSNREKRNTMGHYAGQLSNTRYSWQGIAVQTMGVYETFSDIVKDKQTN